MQDCRGLPSGHPWRQGAVLPFSVFSDENTPSWSVHHGEEFGGAAFAAQPFDGLRDTLGVGIEPSGVKGPPLEQQHVRAGFKAAGGDASRMLEDMGEDVVLSETLLGQELGEKSFRVSQGRLGFLVFDEHVHAPVQ